MKRKIKCGDNPWKNSWHVRMNAKEPKYYCANCGKRFCTGRFSRKDPKIYDDVCPNCGAIGMTFTELIDTYEETRLSENINIQVFEEGFTGTGA